MQVVYHMGVHATDEGQLVGCLLRNRERLARDGIAVPPPARYRPVLRKAFEALQGDADPKQLQETVLDAIVEQDEFSRLILSSDSFLGAANRAVGQGLLYPPAAEKTQNFQRLFPQADCSFFVAIRNPAAFLPAVAARLEGVEFGAFLAGCDPLTLRWSDLIARVRDANPGIPLTVWCDEDAPVIWPEVLRAVAGTGPDLVLEGEDARLAGLMNQTGLVRLRDYLQTHPPETIDQRRRIVTAFLDKFALDDAMELELDLPGWTNDYVAALTDSYEEDAAEIARMRDVTFLGP